MALQVAGNALYADEKSITIGDLTGLPSKTVTTLVPGYVDSSWVPVVTSTGLSDFGITIGPCWFSSPQASGTTLNIKLINASLATAVSSDPVTFKIVVR